ncbi:carboxymuconolactone decarboxylase family protein [Paenibacillus sp. TC-CSREp1]|uniref:carboxymuconolactone decarboxylase family protein n=1 Tax=Paenibacillus sp. TC-CSREp1 TaxID=3410089 RepID=UPI003CFCC0C8
MPIISFSATGDTPFQRLLGHQPAVMQHWNALGDVLEGNSLLSAKLKEEVRRTLAQRNGCLYCRAKGQPDPNPEEIAISMATGLAELFLQTGGNVDRAVFPVLLEHFTEAQISELCAWICFTIASQWFGAALRLEPENDELTSS